MGMNEAISCICVGLKVSAGLVSLAVRIICAAYNSVNIGYQAIRVQHHLLETTIRKRMASRLGFCSYNLTADFR